MSGRPLYYQVTMALLLCLPILKVQAKDDYTLEVGAGFTAGQLPEYLGSPDDYEFVLPFPYIYYQDDSLTIAQNTLKDQLYTIGPFELSLSASGAIPVKSRTGSLRAGMPDLGWVGELGPALEYKLSPQLTLAIQARKAIGFENSSFSDVGWHSSTRLMWHKSLSLHKLGDLILHSELSIDHADSHYHQYYYGVDTSYQTADRAFYAAKSGINNMALSAGLTWRYQQLWLGLYAKYFDLSKAANKASPLLVENNQLSAGIAFSWIFWTNKRGE
jgi:outer membrane scaffolding protein for murein synthesis (MipA/OmpV family)